MTINKRKTSTKPKIVKASRYTQAKKGYLVFADGYPNVKMKYCKTRKSAETQKKKWS
jgi:hypothetical protein